MSATALLPESRARRTARVNRVVLALLGLLLAAAGGTALAAGLGHLPLTGPVLDPAVRAFARDTGWFWPAVGGAGVLLAVGCLRWLMVQARSDRVGRLRLRDADAGRTDLTGRALTTAVEAEIEGWPGVTRASAWLAGSAPAPRLSLRVVLDGRVAPEEVHRRLVTDAVAHARQALERTDLPVRVELVVPAATRRSVR